MATVLVLAVAADRDVAVVAQRREQLDDLYRAMSTHPLVKVVL